MSGVNMLECLSKNKAGIKDVVLFGTVRCAIEKPYFIKTTNLLEGFFILVDIFAVKCLKEDYFSGDSMNIYKTYFVKGSIVAVSNRTDIIGKNIKIFGKNASVGCNIKKQLSSGQKDGVCAFVWGKQGSNWIIIPNTIKDAEEKDIKGTPLESIVMFDIVSNKMNVTYSDSTESFVDFEGVSDYKELDLSNVKEKIVKFDDSNDKVDITKIDLNLTRTDYPVKESQYLEPIEEEVKICKVNKENYAKEIIDDCEKYTRGSEAFEEAEKTAHDIRYRFNRAIVEQSSLPIGNSKVQGRVYVNYLIDAMKDVHFASVEDKGGRDSKQIFETLDAIKREYQLNPDLLMGSNAEYSRILRILDDDYKMATLIMAIITGVSPDSLANNYNTIYRQTSLGTSMWFTLMIENPYLLALLGSGFKYVEDVDKIYFCISRVYKVTDEKDAMEYRDILRIVNGVERQSEKNTLVNVGILKSKSTAFYPKRELDIFKQAGLPLKYDLLEVINAMFSFKHKISRSKMDALFLNPYTSKRVNLLMKKGVLDSLDGDLVMLSGALEKELVIYKKLHDMGRKTTRVSLSQINSVIDDFEKKKGFPLEELQRDGVRLMRYSCAVLSGCAGSGKTTTSDCMTEVIEQKLPKYEIIYITPTGKACRRLAEVVGGTVKTIHSQFKVGFLPESYLYSFKPRGIDENQHYAYIADEMAMCNTDLLYDIVRNLGENDIFYFLGDIKQLSPIGKGMPFAMLMKIVPCVELGVSKRAAEGSLINYNVLLINFLSNDFMKELAFDEDFFVKDDCNDASIPQKVVNSFKELLESGRYLEDDIQVITPYQSPNKSWSSSNLNPLLQDMLREKDQKLFNYREGHFYNNDRVIHTKKNSYDMPRYTIDQDGVFHEVVTFGIANGETGKLVGMKRSQFTSIVPFDKEEYKKSDSFDEKLLEKREEREDDIKEYHLVKEEKIFFAIVQVYDVELKKDVYILYKASRKVNFEDEDGTYLLEGGDLQYLDLAYALTTHKMQGSQSKAVILPFGSSGSPSFVNRNMINVMVTRSQEYVKMIGSVTGMDSAVNKGRRIASPTEAEDILRVLALDKV